MAPAWRRNQVVRIKEVFDVSYAAQRDMVDGFQPVLVKNTFALAGVSGSSLLGKRQNKGSGSVGAGSSDGLAAKAAKAPAHPTKSTPSSTTGPVEQQLAAAVS